MSLCFLAGPLSPCILKTELVDKSRSKATGGTGLGLAIVKHIARIHNARIKLDSVVDEGTTITVIFETAS